MDATTVLLTLVLFVPFGLLTLLQAVEDGRQSISPRDSQRRSQPSNRTMPQ